MYILDDKTPKEVATIVDKVWQAIIERRLQPGARLKEEEMADIFSVSRARVRQAINILEHNGLATVLPNRGAIISNPCVEEAQDVFFVRRATEQRVMQKVCQHCTPKGILRLKKHLENEKKANETGSTLEIVRIAGEFHLLLAELSESRFLQRNMRDLISRSSLIVSVYRSKHADNCSINEHAAIIQAILNKQPEQAMQRMLEHLDHVESQLDLDDSHIPIYDLKHALT